MKKRTKQKAAKSQIPFFVLASATTELSTEATDTVGMNCGDCGTEFHASSNLDSPMCPNCGSANCAPAEIEAPAEATMDEDDVVALVCANADCGTHNIVSAAHAAENSVMHCVVCSAENHYDADAILSGDDEDEADDSEADEADDVDLDDVVESMELDEVIEGGDDSESDDEADDDMGGDSIDDDEDDAELSGPNCHKKEKSGDEAEEDDSESDDDSDADSEDDATDDVTEKDEDDVEVVEIPADQLASYQEDDKVRLVMNAGRNVIHCFVGDVAVARLMRTRAEDPSMFDKSGFISAIKATYQNDGLQATLANYNFDTLNVKVSKNGVFAAQLEAEVTKRVNAINASNVDTTEALDQCLSLASIMLSKNKLQGVVHPLKFALYEQMAAAGIQNGDVIIEAAFNEAGDEYHSLLLAKAMELFGKPAEVRNELATVIADLNPEEVVQAMDDEHDELDAMEDDEVVDVEDTDEDEEAALASVRASRRAPAAKTVEAASLRKTLGSSQLSGRR